MQNKRFAYHLNFCVTALMILGLAACHSAPKFLSPEEEQLKLSDELAKGGYVPTHGLVIDEYSESRNIGGELMDFSMLVPKVSGKYPLILYLPGLGEDVSAGKVWREMWAKSGYVVLSMQPKRYAQALKEVEMEQIGAKGKEDESDNEANKKRQLSRQQTQSSELRYLGHQFFSNESLKLRKELVYSFCIDLFNSIDSGSLPMGSVDFSKVILVGYDLGAQTALEILTDSDHQTSSSNHLKPIAAILFSPTLDLAEGNAKLKPTKNLSNPLLLVEGSEDSDPYAFSSSSVRVGIWNNIPSGNKYLLILNGNVHRLLSGISFKSRGELKEPKDIDNGDDDSFLSSGDDKFQEVNHYGGSSQHRSARGGGGRTDGGGRRRDDQKFKQMAVVASTSMAFLDATVKNEDYAKFWLEEKAVHWLSKAATLHTK